MTICLKFLRQIDPTNCKSDVNHDLLELHSATNKKDILNDNDAIHVFTYAADGLYVQLKKRDKCTSAG